MIYTERFMYFRGTPASNGPATPNAFWTENLQARHLWSFRAQKWNFSHPVPGIRIITLLIAHPSFIESAVLIMVCLRHSSATRSRPKSVWLPASTPPLKQCCRALLGKLQSHLNRHRYPLMYGNWLPFGNSVTKFGTPFSHPRRELSTLPMVRLSKSIQAYGKCGQAMTSVSAVEGKKETELVRCDKRFGCWFPLRLLAHLPK